jgi:hypothetical protein
MSALAKAASEGSTTAVKGAAKSAEDAAQAAADAAQAAAKASEDAAKAAAKASEDAAQAAAKAARGSADTAAKETAEAAAKRAAELRKAAVQAATVAGVLGTGIYLEDKYNKADEDTKDCVKTCLPENWDGFEYGTLKKKELKFSTLPNTSEQPVCKQSMDDCGEYCDKKCTAIHEYKMPGSKAAEGLAGSLGGAVGGVTGSFFEAFNPFAGMSMFGEFTWLPFLISIMCIGIILVWGISKLR